METPRSVLDLPLLFFNYISSIAFVAAPPPPPPSKSGYTFVVGKYRCGNTILILIKFNSDAFSTTIRRFPLIQRNDTMRCDTGTRAPPSHDPWLVVARGKGKKERRSGRRTAAACLGERGRTTIPEIKTDHFSRSIIMREPC